MLKEIIENVLKFGRFLKVNGVDGQLQEIQLKTLRNIEDALKVGQFGFNSKAPIGSRCIVAKIGNEKIVIANEHQSSIIDVASGDSVMYNEVGTYIKLVGGKIEINGNEVEFNCTSIKHNGTTIDNTHTHSQANDPAGNAQTETNPPT